MPRLDQQVQVQQVVSYETEMILRLLLEEINTLRQRAQLPPRTDEQVRQAVKQYLRDHPRPARAQHHA